MKKIKLSKKLNLRKEQIVNLSNIRGGDSSKTKTPDCVITDPTNTNNETCHTNQSCVTNLDCPVSWDTNCIVNSIACTV